MRRTDCVTFLYMICVRATHSSRVISGMTSLRRFTCTDLLLFNNVNLDYYTETVRSVIMVLCGGAQSLFTA